MAVHPELRAAAPAAAVVLAAGAWGALGAPASGDAAAYVAQVATGELVERWTHVGYITSGWLLAGTGLGPMRALEVLAVAAAVAIALGAARWAPHSGAVAAIVAGCAVLPVAGVAEVDALWVALLLCAGIVAHRGLAALAAGSAVAVSPVALLALPWVAVARPRSARAVLAGAVVAVALLSVGSGGEWWFGERGIAAAPTPRPGRALQAWGAALPWGAAVLAASRPSWAWLALLPLLLAPPDTWAWLVGAVAVAVGAARAAPLWWGSCAGRAALVLLLALDVGRAAHRTALDRSRRVEEQVAVEALAGALGPGDSFAGPWTWGARVSVAATGAPYGWVWLAVPPVRDQRARFCAERPRRVALLPPGTPVRWVSAGDPVLRAVASCDATPR